MSKLTALRRTLSAVQMKMKHWADAGWAKTFVSNLEVRRDIESCNQSIDDCMLKFQVCDDCNTMCQSVSDTLILQIISHMGIHEWQTDFKQNVERDHSEAMQYLSDISNSQDIILSVLNQHSDILQRVMAMMQNVTKHSATLAGWKLTPAYRLWQNNS